MDQTLQHAHTGDKSADPPASTCSLLDVLDQLRAAGVTFDLDRSKSTPVLQWSKAPTPAGRAWLEPHLTMLTYVALGRYTGHAPARCSVCGEVAMTPVVGTSGTRRGRKSEPFRKCWMSCDYGTVRRGRRGEAVERNVHCPGLMEIREIDFEGVARRKPPGVPRVPTKKKGTR